MKNKIISALVGTMLSTSAFAMGEDDPIVTKVVIDQLETRISDSDESPLVLEGMMWIGKDLNKLVFKTEVEQVNGELHELELQALYSRAIDPYWDFQIGIRQDQKPNPTKNWLALGFMGIAPYWFEVDSALFISDDDQMNLSFSAEYEWMITQRLVLSPEFEVNFYAKDDEARGVGAGLSDTQLGLRLRYEIKREYAPYIGINMNNKYGKSASFAEAKGGETNSIQFVAGIRAWF